MASLAETVDYVRGHLEIDRIPDSSRALNGLQLENSGRVSRIAAAVDAHLPVVEAAVNADADLLLVHHGLFWQGAQPITGPLYRKLKLAVDHDLAILSIHHPLDAHPELGNNALLGKALNLTGPEPFFYFQGCPIGLRYQTEISRQTLQERLAHILGGPVHVCPAGPETVRKIGICSGGAGSEVASVAQSGIDTFITGEGPHWSYTAAEELGVNLMLGGHYATETFGVKALAEHLAGQFDVDWEFIDHPTGL